MCFAIFQGSYDMGKVPQFIEPWNYFWIIIARDYSSRGSVTGHIFIIKYQGKSLSQDTTMVYFCPTFWNSESSQINQLCKVIASYRGDSMNSKPVYLELSFTSTVLSCGTLHGHVNCLCLSSLNSKKLPLFFYIYIRANSWSCFRIKICERLRRVPGTWLKLPKCLLTSN